MHVVLTGPESTGKTTLALQLQAHYDAILVPEYARIYLNEHGPAYEHHDLKAIAFGQFSSQLSAMQSRNELIISDTCLLTIEIWEAWKYRTADPFIQEWQALQQVDYYLLCKNDLAWEADPLREHPDALDQLFQIYEQKIKESGIPYSIIHGQDTARFNKAKEQIERLKKERAKS